MRISDWSSDVCSSDLWQDVSRRLEQDNAALRRLLSAGPDLSQTFVTGRVIADGGGSFVRTVLVNVGGRDGVRKGQAAIGEGGYVGRVRSEEHTSELQSLMRNSYAVFCFQKQNNNIPTYTAIPT